MSFGMCSRKRVEPYMQPSTFFSIRKWGPGKAISEPRGCMPTTTQVPPARMMLNAWVAASGTPMASKAYSTPMPPVSSRMASSSFSVLELMVWVAPNWVAISSLASMMSMAMILAAPAMRQPWMMLRPMPPQPITATSEPPSTLAV